MSQQYALRASFLTSGIIVALAAFGYAARADAPAVSAPTCKAYSNSRCCDPTVAAHLPLQVVLSSCGKNETQFLGEAGSKDTCKYMFKVGDDSNANTYVQVYAPAQKDPGTSPTDPFFDWARVGKAYV